ncbi:MAG: hypothetical protein HFI82_08475 [Eubacterium sp.]|jgi:hypothetical protein|nr:hypothetical protein [Eubacterium sp.]
MKKAGFLLALIYILLLTGCGTAVSAEEENAISVNLDDVAMQSEPSEQYRDYLAQNTKNMFLDEDGIESADATVSYDEGTEQYSIELSLKTNGNVNSEKIEDYKACLNKTYTDVMLIIDGEVL